MHDIQVQPLSGERAREREGGGGESNLEKAAEEICSSGRPLFSFRCTARRGLLEMSCFLSMVSSMVHLANAS